MNYQTFQPGEPITPGLYFVDENNDAPVPRVVYVYEFRSEMWVNNSELGGSCDHRCWAKYHTPLIGPIPLPN